MAISRQYRQKQTLPVVYEGGRRILERGNSNDESRRRSEAAGFGQLSTRLASLAFHHAHAQALQLRRLSAGAVRRICESALRSNRTEAGIAKESGRAFRAKQESRKQRNSPGGPPHRAVFSYG